MSEDGALPYSRSRFITGVSWDFSQMQSQRRAHGSDLWPCTWAAGGELYCAFGDGGGFDGDSDNVGRVSLGFARIVGRPVEGDAGAFAGRNVWGDAPDYAEHPASFGGKVSSMISVDGTLYAYGALWTSANTPDPVHKGSEGPVKRLIWSRDGAASWQMASWDDPLDCSFLNFGKDTPSADAHVYIYYKRAGDETHAYLARVPKTRLTEDPAVSHAYEYLVSSSADGRRVRWSSVEAQAMSVFTDPAGVAVQVVFDAPLRRYLLTSGHNWQGAAAGELGLFEGAYPWGPWHTVGYYHDWGALGPEARGDFLGLVFPVSWMSSDGRTLWGIFSSLGQYDSFNIVRATLLVQRAGALHSLAARRAHDADR
ncbi:MAG: hypothetical protein JOZ12_00685 [Sinobacteraceae bacterium]|nr:hypothetical protein [Nevskiaceae bacterium]